MSQEFASNVASSEGDAAPGAVSSENLLPGVYLVFEGGGAKGLAHLGAYKAVEEYFEARRQFDEPRPTGPAFRVLGAAGTSVGAIMATLIAAGYTADELYKTPDPYTKEAPPASLFRVSWSSLFFDRREWGAVKKLWAAIGPLFSIELEWLRVCATFLVVGGVMAFCWGPQPLRWFLWVLGALVCGLLAWLAQLWWWYGRALRSIWVRSGIMGTQTFQAWLEDRFRDKVTLADPSIQAVRFSDLPCSVQVISADLTGQRIAIAGRRPTIQRDRIAAQRDRIAAQASVAEAVVDSMTIPLIFQPRQRSEIRVDGGIVANCPDWIFDNEYKSDQAFPLNPTLVFRLGGEAGLNNPRPGRLDYLQDLFLTAVFGDKTPERLLPRGREHTIQLPTPASFMDFDLSITEQDHFFEQARLVTHRYLANPQSFWPAEAWRVERALGKILARFHDTVLAIMPEGTYGPVHLRANVMLTFPNESLGIIYSVRMQQDPDRFPVLRFQKGVGCCGKCWDNYDLCVADLCQTPDEIQSQFEIQEWQQRLIRSTLKSVLSIPLIDLRNQGQQPVEQAFLGVLNIDSDNPLAVEFSVLKDYRRELLLNIGDLVTRELIPIAPTPLVR